METNTMSINIFLHRWSIKRVTYVCKWQSPSRQLYRKLNYSPYIKGSQIGLCVPQHQSNVNEIMWLTFKKMSLSLSFSFFFLTFSSNKLSNKF